MGTRDCKDLLYVFAVVNLVTAVVHANTLGRPKNAKTKTGKSKARRMQEAFASHLRHVGRMDPRGKHPRVVLVIDNAPWHRGQRRKSRPLWNASWTSPPYSALRPCMSKSPGRKP